MEEVYALVAMSGEAIARIVRTYQEKDRAYDAMALLQDETQGTIYRVVPVPHIER